MYSYEDALVIKGNVASKEFNRIHVDSESLVDIFKSTLDKMGITYLRLEHTSTFLKGFGERRLSLMGL